MTLPNISIPVHIPYDIPTMLHPPLVHFAVVIPILVLLFEIVNIFLNSKSLKIITSSLLFLTIIILFGAYLAGTTDGKAAIDSGNFNALSELKEHKLLGMYLFYGSIGVFIFKLLSLVINKTGFRIFYVLILLGFITGIVHQGKEGGELVYKYGANVQVQKDDFDDDEEEKTVPVKTEQKAPEASEKQKTKEIKKVQTAEENQTLVTPTKEENNETNKTK